MEKRQHFNCGQRLREFMSQHSLNQSQVAEIIGETPQSVSAKSGKNDLKVSDIEEIMWSQKKELWEFFVTEEELSKKFNLSVDSIRICKALDEQPTELHELLYETVIRTIESFKRLKVIP